VSRIRTEKFSHPCPFVSKEGWECDDEVILEYEVGKGREDFLLWMEYDEIKCGRGHFVNPNWADAQWEDDCQEMGDREQDRLDLAYDAHVYYLIDKARGK